MNQLAGDHRTPSLLLDTGATDRDKAGRQFRIQQLTFWMTVAGILVAELNQPTLAADRFMLWLAITVLSWIARLWLFSVVGRAEPQEVAASRFLRLLPLAIVSIACAYWIWTVNLFAEAQISIKTIFLCIGFLNTTIAMTAMWYAAPIAVIGYNLSLWGALSYSLYANDRAGIAALLVLNITVAVILWNFVVANAREIRSHTERANELVKLTANLRESNASLDQLRSAAMKDLEARSNFFTEASHDFKQRLHGAKMVVLTARSLIQQKKDAIDAVDRLGEEIDALESYIVNILNFARLESLEVQPSLKTVALQSVFQNLDVQFEAEATGTGKVLRFRPTRLRVATDVFLLERMLSNLISNALHYSRRTVLVAARRSQGGVSIEVWDQGPGIEPAAQERIFQPFQQVSGSMADNSHRGVGLGLAVVARLSRQLQYAVSLTSQVGSGTVLRIWVPGDFVVG